MAYVRQDYYASRFGEIDAKEFERLSWQACKQLDSYTTGIDGVKKLKVAFPTDEEDAESVKMCVCQLIDTMKQIEAAEKSAASLRELKETENGLRGAVISSVTAGNESISYSTKTVADTPIDKAAADKIYRNHLLKEIVWEYLTGVADANGVNLLYMGVYPYA